MSTTTPPPDGSGPEYLEQGGGDRVSRRSEGANGRRTTLITAGAVVALAAAGVGTWAAVSFLGASGQPAEALPADTLGYASVDLDPSGSQKVEAFRMLNKFPAFKAAFGIDAADDIRKRVVEESLEGCDSVDFGQDVEPWLGTSFAVAAVDAGEEQPSPVVVLEVTDAEAAAGGLGKLEECGDGEQGGWSIEGDWAVVAETDEIARQVTDSAAEGTLADDADYQRWLDEVGDPGIVSMYASPDVGPMFAELMASGMAADPAAAGQMPPGVTDRMARMFEDFGGAAGTVRFADGGVELEFAADMPDNNMMMMPVPEGVSLDVVDNLPADTALVYGAALPEDWAQGMLDAFGSYGIPEAELDRGLSQFESQTGLSLPEDLETLLGEQFVIALGSEFDAEVLANSTDPSSIPVGVKVKGDPEGVNSVLEKLATASGMPQLFETETSGDQVVWSPSPDYRSKLASGGSLGESEVYQDVVPDGDRAAGVMFVNFDAGEGLADLAAGDQRVVDNLEPLVALGVSGWTEDDTTYSLVRVTTE